jgi:formamidopyrimidine-DNA glycosylase
MPEVETVARKLRRAVVGKRISAVSLSGLPLRRPIAEDFGRTLQGRAIRKIHRRGKYLIVELSPRAFWVIHLGMSGRIYWRSPDAAFRKHVHATIRFSDCSELHYQDHRRFGLLASYEVRRLEDIPELQALGEDPLSRHFTRDVLWDRLAASRQPVKSWLLDQRRIAGLGNIYACEALFCARIHPERRCSTIGRPAAGRLVEAIREVLRSGIRHGGTSFSDFVDTDGVSGAHQRHLWVFQREGEKCMRCAAKIQRIVQGGRSSFYCPRCQK